MPAGFGGGCTVKGRHLRTYCACDLRAASHSHLPQVCLSQRPLLTPGYDLSAAGQTVAGSCVFRVVRCCTCACSKLVNPESAAGDGKQAAGLETGKPEPSPSGPGTAERAGGAAKGSQTVKGEAGPAQAVKAEGSVQAKAEPGSGQPGAPAVKQEPVQEKQSEEREGEEDDDHEGDSSGDEDDEEEHEVGPAILCKLNMLSCTGEQRSLSQYPSPQNTSARWHKLS